MRNIRGVLAVMLTASFFYTGCSGGSPTGNNPPPPPPVQETLTLTSAYPTTGTTVGQALSTYPNAPVAISAMVTSNKTGNVANVAYTVDGNTVSPPVNVAPGTHNWCYTATAPSGMVLSNCSSPFIFSVSQAGFACSVRMPTANGDYIPQGEYCIAEGQDSVKLDAQGKGFLPSRFALMDSAFIVARGDSTMVTLAHEIPKSLFGRLDVVGWPRSLDIINATIAVPAPTFTSFFMFWPSFTSNVKNTYFAGRWLSYPVCVAFAGVSSQFYASNDSVTFADSVAFWGILAQAMQKYGQINGANLVKPCSEGTVRNIGGILVTLQLQPGVVSTDFGAVTTGFFGDYTSGQIIMNSHDAFATAFFVWHEFGHAFWGIGHTCAWDSIMRSSCPRYVPDLISDTDVAYVQQRFRTRDYELRYGTRLSLVMAVAGAQLERGIPLTPTVIVDANGNIIK